MFKEKEAKEASGETMPKLCLKPSQHLAHSDVPPVQLLWLYLFIFSLFKPYVSPASL